MDRTQNMTNIRILDKEYQIHCPEGQSEPLQQAALYLDRKMREIRRSGRVIGLERIAIMAALNIAFECVTGSSADSSLSETEDFEGRLEVLQSKLDDALSQVAPVTAATD